MVTPGGESAASPGRSDASAQHGSLSRTTALLFALQLSWCTPHRTRASAPRPPERAQSQRTEPPPPTPAPPAPAPPAAPEPEHSWRELMIVGADSRQVFATIGSARVIVEGRRWSAVVSDDSDLVIASPAPSGWLFLTNDGAVVACDSFLGPLRQIGQAGAAEWPRHPSEGMLVVQGDYGRFWISDGRTLRRVRGLRSIRTMAFVDARRGAAITSDERLYVTTDAGRTWTASRTATAVPLELRRTDAGLEAQTTLGSTLIHPAPFAGRRALRPDERAAIVDALDTLTNDRTRSGAAGSTGSSPAPGSPALSGEAPPGTAQDRIPVGTGYVGLHAEAPTPWRPHEFSAITPGGTQGADDLHSGPRRSAVLSSPAALGEIVQAWAPGPIAVERAGNGPGGTVGILWRGRDSSGDYAARAVLPAGRYAAMLAAAPQSAPDESIPPAAQHPMLRLIATTRTGALLGAARDERATAERVFWIGTNGAVRSVEFGSLQLFVLGAVALPDGSALVLLDGHSAGSRGPRAEVPRFRDDDPAAYESRVLVLAEIDRTGGLRSHRLRSLPAIDWTLAYVYESPRGWALALSRSRLTSEADAARLDLYPLRSSGLGRLEVPYSQAELAVCQGPRLRDPVRLHSFPPRAPAEYNVPLGSQDGSLPYADGTHVVYSNLRHAPCIRSVDGAGLVIEAGRAADSEALSGARFRAVHLEARGDQLAGSADDGQAVIELRAAVESYTNEDSM